MEGTKKIKNIKKAKFFHQLKVKHTRAESRRAIRSTCGMNVGARSRNCRRLSESMLTLPGSPTNAQRYLYIIHNTMAITDNTINMKAGEKQRQSCTILADRKLKK